MASRGRSGGRSRRFEVLALGLGVASSLVMLLAAAQIRSRPEWAGKLALDEAARELAGAVEVEWAAVLRSEELGARGLPRVPVDETRLEQVRLLSSPAEQGTAPEISIDPEAAAAFDALFAEARYQEVERRDLERAIEAIGSALDFEIDPARRARGRLRAVQLGLRAKRESLVREQWAAVRAETTATGGPLSERGLEEGISCALLTGLAVAEVLDEPERDELGLELASWWREGRAGVVGGASLKRAEQGMLFAQTRPVLRVLLQSIVELAGTAAVGLEEEIEERARIEAFVRWAETNEMGPEELLETGSTGVRFVVRDPDVLVIRSRGEVTHCFFQLSAEIHRELQDRLETLASFGRGFHVDLTGERTELGEQVRPWTELDGGHFGFLLRHENPTAFIEDEERRLGFLQLALVGMALITLLAGFASFGGLRRQRRLQELKTGFIARVSHELRTPVTGILLAIEGLVEGRARTPQRQERYLGLIQGEAHRLERLIANVLDFSRLDRGEGPRLDRQSIEVSTLAESLQSLVAARCAAAELKLESRVEVGVATVQADVEALRRALMNLVDNALGHAQASCLTFEAVAGDGELRLALTDDGRGIEPRLRERIFEPFRQGPVEMEGPSNGAGGAGLGLAIVREIARGHGGRVACSAGPDGRGCRFELSLPLDPERPQQSGTGDE